MQELKTMEAKREELARVVDEIKRLYNDTYWVGNSGVTITDEVARRYETCLKEYAGKLVGSIASEIMCDDEFFAKWEGTPVRYKAFQKALGYAMFGDKYSPDTWKGAGYNVYLYSDRPFISVTYVEYDAQNDYCWGTDLGLHDSNPVYMVNTDRELGRDTEYKVGHSPYPRVYEVEQLDFAEIREQCENIDAIRKVYRREFESFIKNLRGDLKSESMGLCTLYDAINPDSRCF